MKSVRLGKYIPFFMGNTNLDNYYLYQVDSPGINEESYDYEPLVTLKLLAEKTRNFDFTAKKILEDKKKAKLFDQKKGLPSGNVLIDLMRKRDGQEGMCKYLEERTLGRLDTDFTVFPSTNPHGFPYLTAGEGVLKSLVIGLRDSAKWGTYSSEPGCYIDILDDWDKFSLYKIVGSVNEFKLEYIGTYANKNIADLSAGKSVNKLTANKKVLTASPTFSGKTAKQDLIKFCRMQEWKNLRD